MRRLAVWLVVLALMWSGLWLGAAQLAKRGVSDWAAAQQQSGLMAGFEDVAVQGWPARWQLTLAAPYFADPWAGLSWTGPRTQVTLDALRPTALQATMPGRQTLHSPAGTLTLDSEALQGAVALAGTDLALDSAGLRARMLDMAGPEGLGLRVGTLDLDLRRGDAPTGYALNWEATAIQPDPRQTTLPGADGPMPAEIGRIALRTLLELSAPLDRHAGTAAAPPALQVIAVEDIALDWGRATITGSGRVQADAAGLAEGEIVLEVRNWPDLIAASVALGWLDAELVPTWTQMLTLLQDETPAAAAEGVLVARLRFGNGRMRLGPLPMGPAPVMVPQGF